jgi:hypothetical protein
MTGNVMFGGIGDPDVTNLDGSKELLTQTQSYTFGTNMHSGAKPKKSPALLLLHDILITLSILVT